MEKIEKRTNGVWFYRDDSDLSIRHRTAYEKSLTSNHAVRVRSGMYYYKGYEVEWHEEGAKDYQWSYGEVGGHWSDVEFVKTKAECLKDIDSNIEWDKERTEFVDE